MAFGGKAAWGTTSWGNAPAPPPIPTQLKQIVVSQGGVTYRLRTAKPRNVIG